MLSENTHRKLTAILCADVVGYSRLMGDDDEATIETLTAYRKIFLSQIESHRGRVVDAKGDAILAEFASVVDAVGGAVEIQRELAEKNAGLSDERRMDFRIGINLGDVVVKDDVIYGDGVNVAARLEALAEPGGICISRNVHDQVQSKLKLECEYLGEQQVKNIDEPVRAYCVKFALMEKDHRVEQLKPAFIGSTLPDGLSLELPDRPSIAVLAFENMSSDPDQDYFGDGISEDIITDLAKINGLLVIGRNSSFSYKGKNTDLRQIGKELNVRYVLEGSVRRSGNRVRVTAQLVEAASGHHAWADRFDRELADIFLIGDEITEEIVSALEVKLVHGEQARMFRKAMKTPKGRKLFNQAIELMHQGTQESVIRSIELLEEARIEEPESAPGYGSAAWLIVISVWRGWRNDPLAFTAKAHQLANRALELDQYNAAGHGALAMISLLQGKHDDALAKGMESVTSKPVCAGPKSLLANIMMYSGKPDEAITLIREAMRITPLYPDEFLYVLGMAHYLCGNYQNALTTATAIVKRNIEHLGAHIILACVHGANGHVEKAQAEAKTIQAINSRFSLSQFAMAPPFKNAEVRERILDDLRKAGLPE